MRHKGAVEIENKVIEDGGANNDVDKIAVVHEPPQHPETVRVLL